MTRAGALRTLLASTLVGACLGPSAGLAQTTTRSPLAAGEVTGLELGLDGARSVARGGTLRWFFTLYEVVGQDRLRPARAGRLRALASFRPDGAVAELETDARGRAELELPVPADVDGFQLAVEASTATASRRFQIEISTTVPGRVDLAADRVEVQPGETVTVVGRALRLPSGRPAAGERVRLTLADGDGRALGAAPELETGPTGAFLHSFAAPGGPSEVRVRAEVAGLGAASSSIAVRPRPAPRLAVRAVPRERAVAPGASVPVDVVVRRSDGRPVPGARVSMRGQPADREREIRTDAAGRALLAWTAPLVLETGVMDLMEVVSAERAGLGRAETELRVRVAREPFRVGVSVEGGGLLADLPSRLYVRVVRADGSAARDLVVHVEGPLVGALDGRTDAEGVAVLEARPLVEPGLEGRDRCGGLTASSVVVEVGEGPERTRSERCVPVDPDGAVRVRPASAVVASGGRLEAELFVAAPTARAPVEVALLRRDDASGGLVPAARRIVEPPGETRRVSVELPPDLVGEVLVRARPLVGPALEPARGGTALVWATPGERLDAAVRASGSRAAEISFGAPRAAVEGTVLVVPAEESDELVERLRRAMVPALGQLLGERAASGGPLVDGWLAARTPRDDAAPAVLRGGVAVVLPAPEDPPAHGVLRDPVRARERFVRGRLGLIARTLEARLEEASPERVGDLGVRGPGGWTFNREALRAVVGWRLLAAREPTTLGGEPLGLEDLERLDPTFTFDSVARRVTRKRLLALLVRLRDFVRDRELDLWQRDGDPGLWLDLLVDERDGDEGSSRAALHDGWGQRMAIRRAPGGRARFRFLAPLPPGYELVSAGPDGRFGTGDDVLDPFARVLPSGSAYAEAVAEDDLLARLNRVELGQATLEAVARAYERADGPDAAEPRGELPGTAEGWDAVPGPLGDAADPDDFERRWLAVSRSAPTLGVLESSASRPFEVDEEPRRWSLVALAFTPEGWASLARAGFRAGFPLVLAAGSPGRLEPDRPLSFPVAGALLPGGPRDLLLSVGSSGAVRAELEAGGSEAPVRLGPGGGFEARVRVRGVAEGRGSVRLALGARSGAGARVLDLPVEVLAPGSLREQAAAAAVSARTDLRVELPRDAEAPRAELVLRSPTAFAEDPALGPWLERDPALVAWALAVSGQPIPEGLRRRLERATGRDGRSAGESPALSTACAAVAWAAVDGSAADWAPAATARAVRREGGEDEVSRLSGDAAVLAALSLAATGEEDSPLAATVQSIRDDLRGAVRRHRDQPALLARGAAALLLADGRDLRGLTMLDLAGRRLVRGFGGGRAVDLARAEPPRRRAGASGRDGAEQLVATAALAIAAHQAGDRELADELGRGLAARSHVATALGGEPLFWLLAARAFGVFGISEAGERLAVTVSRDGGPPERIELGPEAVVVPLSPPPPGRRAAVRVERVGTGAALPLVSLRATYLRPARQADGGPLRAELSGDVGFAGERAAFAVAVSNAGEARVERPVLLVQLPAGAELDSVARAAIERTGGATSIDEPDRRGVVRLRLSPLEPAETLRLPLPLRWTAGGRRTGPSLAVFPEDRSWELGLSPPGELDVPFRP